MTDSITGTLTSVHAGPDGVFIHIDISGHNDVKSASAFVSNDHTRARYTIAYFDCDTNMIASRTAARRVERNVLQQVIEQAEDV